MLYFLGVCIATPFDFRVVDVSSLPRSLQSLSPHTVDGQFVWRTGWEGENIIDLVYVDLWLHLELVNWLFLEIDWSGATTTGGTIIMRNRSVHMSISTSLFGKMNPFRKKKKRATGWKMMTSTGKHPDVSPSMISTEKRLLF